jgi:hypothetical protein
MIQWSFACNNHPYQKSPIGTKTAPTIINGVLYAGRFSPLFLAMKRLYDWRWLISNGEDPKYRPSELLHEPYIAEV